MAKIALRAYFREIEGLIEHGQLDEALAHSKHILQFYPKNIAAYRLLGKTFLEEQRYGDAADVFQRVLSAIPDDFVSQVGMSIIREDEGNLDAAIWHMERAFEVQPYNAAIQDELRRLFARRDGVEPHKIRLTRGALARMYAKGDLYPQAIAELRTALAEDAQRPDLQILLARMYYLNGSLVESVDMCSILLKKIPYCLEANRLLATILPQTERKDEAKVYQQRVVALDPYLAAAPIATTSSDSVPENLASLEKLDYKAAAPGASATSQPAWAASLGVTLDGFTPSEEPLPDWMTSEEKETTGTGKAGSEDIFQAAPFGLPGVPFTEQSEGKPEALFPSEPQKSSDQGGEPSVTQGPPDQPSPVPARLPWETDSDLNKGIPDWLTPSAESPGDIIGSKTPAVTGSLIPSWMKEAGWEPGGEEGESSARPEVPEEGQAETEVARGEIPDWLRDMAPEDLTQGKAEEEEGLPWLEEIARPSDSGEKLPDWLAASQEESQPPSELQPETPTMEQAAPEEAVPSEPMALESEPEEMVTPEAAPPEAALIMEPEEATPLEPVSFQAEAMETNFLETSLTQPADTETTAETGEGPGEVPDWLKTIEAGTPAENLAAEEKVPDWLLQPPVSEEPSPEPTQEEILPAQELPDWLRAMEAETQSELILGDTQPVRVGTSQAAPPVEGEQEVPATPGFEEKLPEITSPESGLSDQEAALAWLESLAARQGAAEEELITRPEERSTELPSWLQEAAAQPAEAPAGEQKAEALPIQPSPSEPIPAEEGAVGMAEGEWQVEAKDTFAEAQPPEATLAEPAAAEETAVPAELPDWLKGPETEDEIQATAEAGEPAQPASELPDWLKEAMVEAPSESSLAPEPTGPEAAEIPGWLMELKEEAGEGGVEAAATPSEASETELPVWLKELQEAQATDTIAEQPPAGQAEAVPPLQAEERPAEVVSEAALSDQDAALAWLESLAARQGAAEEELITRPEERSTELPSWVQEEGIESAQAAQPETQPAEETAALEAAPPPEMVELPPAGEEQPPALEEEPHPVELPPAVPAETPAEPVEPIEIEEIAPAGEVEPELPGWIARIAADQPEEEELWVPPEMPAEAPPSWAEPPRELPFEELPAVEAAPAAGGYPSEAAGPQININTASLIELENLPGVGFVMAQKILAHREAYGPFNQIDDLLKVPDFNPLMLEDVRSRIKTGLEQTQFGIKAFEALEPDTTDQDQAVLIQARNALVQENIPETVSRYSYLVKKERALDTVISDLHEALYRFPRDVSMWQTLGDAYMRNNQLQEALDAYGKAEELLR